MRVIAVLAVAAAVGLGMTAGAQPSPAAEPPAAPLVVGLTVPWAVGGPRIEADGSLREFPGEWPTIPFRSIRLWDTRTAWLNIEPRKGHWDFARLDSFVTKSVAHGVADISLVLGGTPRWAAKQVRPTDAPWMGPGSASPPKQLSDWAEFVTKVAARYRGRITSYEIWNEPNNVTFWSGNVAEWTALVGSAARSIRAVDPSATVVASGFKLASLNDVGRIAPWIAALSDVRPAIDNVSIHWYPDAASDLAAVAVAVPAIALRSKAAGVTGAVWITEVNLRRGAKLPAAAQRAAVDELTEASHRAGAGRLTWYAWTDLGPPELMPLYPGTPAARAIRDLMPR